METTGKDSITIETILHAPIEKVWEAWTNPSVILKWFGSDPNGSVLEAILDVRVGGNFEITFKNADETRYTCSGIYHEVDKWRKLAFSWGWKNEPGIESFVMVSLTPENNRTLMHFEHSHLGYASEHDYSYGWKSTFLKLEKALGSQNK